jgi:hypothetical protein
MGHTYVFYHIFCKKSTENIVRDQITKIIFSGLYDVVNNIFCFLTGEEDEIRKIETILKDSGEKFNITAIGINDKSFERFTLHKIRNYITGDDKFLYIHSKGVTYNSSNVGGTRDWSCVRDWRTYMEYFTIAKHTTCISLLDSHQTVGVNYYDTPWKHFSGNFWWCRGDYFLTLPKSEDLDIKEDDIFSFTENYVGMNDPTVFCFHKTGAPHYTVAYPYKHYVGGTNGSPLTPSLIPRT